MPGGWTMSMSWMRMPGLTWLWCARVVSGRSSGSWLMGDVAAVATPDAAAYARPSSRGEGSEARNLSVGKVTALVGPPVGYFFIWNACRRGRPSRGALGATFTLRSQAISARTLGVRFMSSRAAGP
jgi:hypothetical protein